MLTTVFSNTTHRHRYINIYMIYISRFFLLKESQTNYTTSLCLNVSSLLLIMAQMQF